MLTPRMEELINAILDGEVSEQDVAELQSLIVDRPGFAEELADRISEHRLLGLIFQPFDEKLCVDSIMREISNEERSTADRIVGNIERLDACGPAKAPAERDSFAQGRQWLLGLSLSIAASLVVFVAIWYTATTQNGNLTNPSNSGNFPENETGVPLATLLLESDCVWEAQTGLGEGKRLTPQTLNLVSGTAIVRLDGGAKVIMTGETSLSLVSAGHAQLRYGDVVIRAEYGADGFELTTPASPLVDLGTEFAVHVDQAGNTEVHVLEGEVEYVRGDSPDVLLEGKAIRFQGSDRTIQDVAMNAPRFEEVVKRVNPKPQPQRMFAYEGFFYEPGVLSLDETTKGKGWAGPWRLRQGEELTFPASDSSPDHFNIVHGQMNVTWPVPGGRQGMLQLPSGGAYYVRPLEDSIDLDQDQVTYFSFMVRETERPTTKKARVRERLRLTFRDSTKYYNEFISFGQGPGFQPHIHTGGGIAHVSPIELPAEQTTLWIGKIISTKNGEDEIYFRVYGEDDVLGFAEPATWHVVSRGVTLNGHLDRVLLSSNSSTPCIVDELRIGPTWRSVAPMLEK
ncbi:FecR domain-containing protein [Bremerella sp. T1]|uniref:FecR domain-containing protein n=1 Tax=Bremerella sp. TYQ1 TaxID=3119568 RepID=UPI001CC9A77C|nr:FecR domain-containing protein [Bremerella volcania]UBM36700.1 FecR family protein [Bremerella volcania]